VAYLMQLVTVKLPELYIEGLDILVKEGRYVSRSEAIRVAVRELLRRELWSQEKQKEQERDNTRKTPLPRI